MGGGGCVGLFVILFIVALVMSNKDKTASESPGASDSGSAPEARPLAPIGNPPLAPDRPFVAALEAWTERVHERARNSSSRRWGIVLGPRDRYTGGVEAKPAYYGRIGGLPVEKDARIDDDLKEEGWRLVKAIQRAGFRCETLSSMNPLLWLGYVVSCNGDSLTYKVEALGINAKVTQRETR